ncbi:hypothetical protein QBC32DRAFT_247399 [Pseudoneurospora amorphoporcata]|uniref:Uncharacterized protein n=1 Tax=Pseudoneurospora amorphoporcata TaxID=241081 RepID=A0AAN6NKN9_9PEZI|nr:hypothetical protein QBC32DRAFT_247399 [Pseudoneurospora amorphoporcata]
MADIFGTGSAVLGVATAAIKLFTLIVEIADATRTIRRQIHNDALPFRSFRDLIETAEYLIKFRLPEAGRELVGYMHDRNIFWCIAEEAKALDDEINEQMEKIQLLKQKYANDHSSYPNRFYAAWRWEKIRKPKLELLHPRMEQLKSTIQLILAMIQLEVMARNGEGSRSRGKMEEIEKLRELIRKHLEAIEQLRRDFPPVAKPGSRNRRADSAAEICYLASTIRNRGKVPEIAQDLPPPPVSAFRQTLGDTPDFESRPGTELPSTTCPRCYRSFRTPGQTRSQSVALVQESVQNTGPEGYQPRPPTPQHDIQSPPAQETAPVITAPRVHTTREPPNQDSDDDPSTVPNGPLDVPAPWLTHSRRPSAERLPPVITSVEILDYRNQWRSLPVRLDTSLHIPNRHDAGRREINYYGIVSLRMLIDKLGWPEATLLEDPKFVEIRNGNRFNWDLKRHEGIGRVELTWRVDQTDDEWAIGVVPKLTRECIVSREDPCEQGVVLKAMPAAQNA